MTEDKGFLYRTLEAIEDNLFGVVIACSVLGGVGTWSYKMYSSYNDTMLKREAIRAGLEVKVGDYNGNEKLDKYYEISGEKIPVEVDGKPIREYIE